MLSGLTRLRLLLADRLRFSVTFRRFLSYILEAAARFALIVGGDKVTAIKLLSRAARSLHRDVSSIEAIIVRTMSGWNPQGFDWDRHFPLSKPNSVRKALILKRPQANGEKGVLFVAFEDHWLRLFRHANIAKLAQDYDLILSPTWSPPHDAAFLIAAKLWPGTLYTILSNFADQDTFRKIAKNVETIPLLASSWVNPETFAPKGPVEKEFDVVMLANFSIYKRHFALLHALRSMAPDVRVLLLGQQGEGRTRATIEAEARAFGVWDKVTIKEGLDDDAMVRAVHSAKVAVIMSNGEGSCVAVNECMFANLPFGIIEGARIGSGVYINAQTGRFLRPGDYARDLTALIADHATFQPRKWMLENGISYQESSVKLNQSMKSFAVSAGRPWTVDLVPMQWRPNAEYVSQADADCMASAYDSFESDYGIQLAWGRWQKKSNIEVMAQELKR